MRQPKAMNDFEEFAVVELRKTLLLPLEDLLVAAQEFINPKISRTALECCLRRYGVGNLRKLMTREVGAENPKTTIMSRPPGHVHIEVKCLPQMSDEPGRTYLYAGIDKASRWAYLEIRSNKNAGSTAGFLKKLGKEAPFRITRVSTYNEDAFTNQCGTLGNRKRTARHAFEKTCRENRIEHNLITLRTEQTDDGKDGVNGKTENSLQHIRTGSSRQLENIIRTCCRYYNDHISQKRLGHKTPNQAINGWKKQNPELFNKTFCDIMHPAVTSGENDRTTAASLPVSTIAGQGRKEKDLRLNRALLALSSCNQALLHGDNEMQLLHDICRIVVETGDYGIAWVGYAIHDAAKTIRPVAQVGIEERYIEMLRITWADTEHGRGPTGRAIRTGQVCSVGNIPTDPQFAPWREKAMKLGYASVISFPLKTADHRVFGALSIYSTKPYGFNEEETGILVSLAENLAFGITTIRARKALVLAEKKLLQSEARHRRLFENKIIVMLIIDPSDGRIVDANPAAVSFYGWERDVLLRKKISDINMLNEVDVQAEMQRAVEKECNHFSFRHRRADGSIRDVEVTSTTIFAEDKPLLYSIINDITERKQYQEQLARNNERMQFIMQATGTGFWETELASNTSFVSDELWRLHGLDPLKTDPSREYWLQSMLPEDRENAEKSVSNALKNGSEFNCSWRIRNADDSIRWLMSKGIPCRNDDGKVTRYVGIVTDITDRKKDEENMRQMESILRKNQRLETIGTLAGGIAHDFNNILTPILGYAEMGISSIAKEEPLHDYFSEIMLAAERARNLVEQILTFSRAQEGNPSAVSVQSVIAEALKLLRPSIPATIAIKQHIESTCRNILIDPSQIHQVIVSLFSNACHALEKSGGTITLTLKEMHPDADMQKILPDPPAEHYLQLSVADTGIGMDETTMERIFEPYFSTKAVNKGSGLGLSVVHGIVTSNNGVITAESLQGKGTTFRVYLPVIEHPVINTARQEIAATGNGSSILFVDDEQATIKMTKRMLSRLGYQICALSSPQKALERFRLHPDRFDLLITDLTMPEMNGITLAYELHKTRPGLPVILMTGYGKDIGDSALNQSKIRKCLKKPLKMAELAAAIREIIPNENA
ncbi:MAG: PAS domain S-box protein [Chlorobiaceae bacterium]|nr:PAS domain S-box protein [Chlorobiaceae bacterium]